MEIKVRIAEEKDVEWVAMLYERLHDYLETHENSNLLEPNTAIHTVTYQAGNLKKGLLLFSAPQNLCRCHLFVA